ncbi:switch-associated protein 70-like [Actinia tenebrosa]|uniref:Switch-associated protein 70-like n=1 Tax=Actinia tenebrosa TaxID=6105 RepID=A0A6P8I0I0_ACTTE|nr:switch-associated protein 70-like [Actinia tenebrosa]
MKVGVFFPQRMKLNERSLAQFSISSAPIDKEGYLNKKGELNRGYQRRWFVLKGNLLYYFERKGDKEAIGVVILENCHVELAESEDQLYAFQISYGGAGSRTYVLGADSSQEMESWMKAVTNASYLYLKMMVEDLEKRLQDLTTSQNEMVNDSLSDSERFLDSTESADAEVKVNRHSASQIVENRLSISKPMPASRTPDSFGKFEPTVGTLIDFDSLPEQDTEFYSMGKSPEDLLPLNFNEFQHLEALHARELDSQREKSQVSQDDSLLGQRLAAGNIRAPRSKSERRRNLKPDISDVSSYRSITQTFTDEACGLTDQGSVFKRLHEKYGASIWVKVKECGKKDAFLD